MKAFGATITLALASAAEISVMKLQYMNHVAKYGKYIDSADEFATRMGYFTEADKVIEKHNTGSHSFTMAHNQFSDWSKDEYEYLLGCKADDDNAEKTFKTFDESNNDMTVDWSAIGAVTPVKDQGNCGSCWAFSATGALESKHWIESGHLLSFSEQQQVSCNEPCGGCDGYGPSFAFDFWKETNAATEDDYPYKGHDSSCKHDYDKSDVSISSWANVTSNDVSQFKAALYF